MTHTVFFWLEDDIDDSQRAFFEAELKKLPQIDAVRSGKIGKPAPTPERPVTDHSFSYHLSLTFDSMENHDAYQVHADHDVFIANCKDLWSRVLVYDSV